MAKSDFKGHLIVSQIDKKPPSQSLEANLQKIQNESQLQKDHQDN